VRSGDIKRTFVEKCNFMGKNSNSPGIKENNIKGGRKNYHQEK